MTTDSSELKSYEARFYVDPAYELQEKAARDNSRAAPLPRVHARTAKEAAELASAWYGEVDRVGSDGSSVLLEDRVVEVRQEGGSWQRFVVSKRLVVERTATELPPRGSWLLLLHAVWTRYVAGVGGAFLGDLTAFQAWRSGGRVRFEYSTERDSAPGQGTLELGADGDHRVAVIVLEALIPEYLNLKDHFVKRDLALGLRMLQGFQTTWEGMTESDRARHERVEQIVDGLRLSVADWQQLTVTDWQRQLMGGQS